jgi:hypothetical protein
MKEKLLGEDLKMFFVTKILILKSLKALNLTNSL